MEAYSEFALTVVLRCVDGCIDRATDTYNSLVIHHLIMIKYIFVGNNQMVHGFGVRLHDYAFNRCLILDGSHPGA